MSKKRKSHSSKFEAKADLKAIGELKADRGDIRIFDRDNPIAAKGFHEPRSIDNLREGPRVGPPGTIREIPIRS